MKGTDLYDHFRRKGHWVNWNQTTDTFKAGDPKREVSRIAVVWKADFEALRNAHQQGAELVVSHESISMYAQNNSVEPEIVTAVQTEMRKFEWLAETGMVVFRCHDFWDGYPEIGVRWAWQKGLNLGGKIIADAYPLLVTEFAPISLGELANHVLERVRPLGQDVILVCGELDRRVSRLATGTGVTVDPVRMVKLGADAGIMTDDFYRHVREGAHARELGLATLHVNHGVSEFWGIENLARYLQETFPQVEVFHISQQCPYTGITGQA